MDPAPPISPSQSMEEDRASSRVVHTVARSVSGRTGGEGGSCIGSQQHAAWRLQSRREAARPAEGVPGAGPWSPAVQPQRGRGGVSSARCSRAAQGSDPAEKRGPRPARSGGGRAAGTRALGVFPASRRGISAPQDHGSFCPRSLLSSLTLFTSGTRVRGWLEWWTAPAGMLRSSRWVWGVVPSAPLGTIRTWLWVSHLEQRAFFF